MVCVSKPKSSNTTIDTSYCNNKFWILGNLDVTEDDLNVLPEVVDPMSVRVVGTWDSFNISWQPITNVNFGTVFYEIKIGENDPPVSENQIYPSFF